MLWFAGILADKQGEMPLSVTALTVINQAREQVDSAAQSVQRATAPIQPPSEDRLDLSTAAVQLLTARTAFQAGIELARTADQIEASTIDLLA